MSLPVNELRTLIAGALGGLLLLLRLDAARFASAEYDSDPEAIDQRGVRLAWPLMAIVLAIGVGVALPEGLSAIGLGRGSLLSPASIVLAIVGAAVAVVALLGLAWLRGATWPPRLSPPGDTARFAFDSVATAIVDELTFRGVLLGLLLLAGIPAGVAFLVQLLLYGLETRLGRSVATLDMLVEALALGALTGVLAIASGAVLAPIVAHVVARFAALELPDSAPALYPRRLL